MPGVRGANYRLVGPVRLVLNIFAGSVIPRSSPICLCNASGRSVSADQDLIASLQPLEQAARYPRPRTKCGPIKFAIGNGRRFQTAMKLAYFGLFGFLSGIAAPGGR